MARAKNALQFRGLLGVTMGNQKKSVDHKGIEYPSVIAKCNAYNIDKGLYLSRVKRGWGEEKALATPVRKIKSYNEDHLGNKFKNADEMCAQYKVSYTAFMSRMDSGWELKDALTIPVEKRSQNKEYIKISGLYVDPWGESFKTKSEMAEAHGINLQVLSSRVSKGWTLKEALSIPLGGKLHPEIKIKCKPHNKHITDPWGNEFNNYREMARAHNLSEDILRDRLKRGWSMEKALTAPINGANGEYIGKECYDHTGRRFPSIKAKCKFWNITASAYNARIKKGMLEKDALTTPVKQKKQTITYNGIKYEKLSDFCNDYNITLEIYYNRAGLGWDLKRIVETPCYGDKGIRIKDHLGNPYSSIKAMCKAYGKNAASYYTGIKQGKSIEEILTAPKKGAEITVFGHTYNNAKEFCKTVGISQTTYKKYIEKGFSPEKIVTMVKARDEGNRKDNKKAVKLEVIKTIGKYKYRSIKELCSKIGITYSTYREYRSKGYSIEQIVDMADNKQFRTTKRSLVSIHIDHKGIDYGNKPNMLKEYGLPKHVFDRRILEEGMTLEQALTTPYKGKKQSLAEEYEQRKGEIYTNRQRLTMKILDYKGFDDVTVEFVDDGTIIRHLRYAEIQKGSVLNPNYESPVTLGKRKAIEGTSYLSKHGLYVTCEKYISSRELICKYEDGTTITASSHAWRHDKLPYPFKYTDHAGNTFKTLGDMLEKYNVPEAVYFRRKADGWTLEEILLIPPGWRENKNSYSKLFESNGVPYYGWKCPVCEREYVYSKANIRAHYLVHIKNSATKEDANQ